jgi:hypothetical protein
MPTGPDSQRVGERERFAFPDVAGWLCNFWQQRHAFKDEQNLAPVAFCSANISSSMIGGVGTERSEDRLYRVSH